MAHFSEISKMDLPILPSFHHLLFSRLESVLFCAWKTKENKPFSGWKCQACSYLTITVTFMVKGKNRNNKNREENLPCSSEKIPAWMKILLGWRTHGKWNERTTVRIQYSMLQFFILSIWCNIQSINICL